MPAQSTMGLADGPTMPSSDWRRLSGDSVPDSLPELQAQLFVHLATGLVIGGQCVGWSMIRSTGMVSPARNDSVTSTDRWRGPPSAMARPSCSTSSGPRIRNSIAHKDRCATLGPPWNPLRSLARHAQERPKAGAPQ
jgi:hypothetical protein